MKDFTLEEGICVPNVCEVCGREEPFAEELEEGAAMLDPHLFVCERCIEDRRPE